MKRILIADASKASLVMTSEVFKDNFQGVQVIVARTSAEAIELAKTCGDVDAFIIDFDLPDTNGAITAAEIKKFSATPVLLTGYDRPEVQEFINRDLAGFEDCQNWVKKPVRADTIVQIAQRYCVGKYRCQRRINCKISVEVDIFRPVTKSSKKPSAKDLPETNTSQSKAAKPSQAIQFEKATLKGVIEDVSLEGMRLRLNEKPTTASFAKAFAGSSFGEDCLKAGAQVHIRVTTEASAEAKKTPTVTGTLSALRPAAKTQKASRDTIVGCVKWNAADNNTWTFGIQAASAQGYKDLFELEMARKTLNAKAEAAQKAETDAIDAATAAAAIAQKAARSRSVKTRSPKPN